ncbi:lanthionine synthetase LanC family protein [Streptomyces sp. RK75]|uniref:lanthionine synthetase LanC family protein n=1 Tax=Streptomyces sp. RK75 TaxID=2824895 RepID=UPI000C3AF09F|nr:lanthionine synthetase LanC family protein [Streptomyces sp. RK75]
MYQPALTENGTRTVALRLALTALDRWTDRARRAAVQRPPDVSPETFSDPSPGTPSDDPHGSPPEYPGDPGIPVLARLVAAAGDAEAATVAGRAAAVWARRAGRGPGHRGLYDGGLAGTLVGLRQCAVLHPALHPVADRLRDRLLDRSVSGRVRYGAVTFPDYDLMLGPSGVLLALTADLPGAGGARGAVADTRSTADGIDDTRRAPKGFGKGLAQGCTTKGGASVGDGGPYGPGPYGPGQDGPGPYGPGPGGQRPDGGGPGVASGRGSGGGPVEAGLSAYAEHLAALCDDLQLAGLRTRYPGRPLLGWVDGRINTGMGHGVAGVTAALGAAVRRLGPRPELTAALSHTCHWLAGESFDDARDIRTWNGCGSDGAPRLPGANARQGWCYGTPGVSWAMWEAADVLGDGVAAAWAASAFTSLAEGFHEGYHLFGDHIGDRLGLCHGAGGVLLVADALHRHGRLPAATGLRARLLAHLASHEEELATLADERYGLLSGGTGALAAMLTATGGSRTWLPCLGLR